MSLYIYKFKNIDNTPFYVNINRIEYAMFLEVPNAPHLKRAYIRCGEGLIDTQVSTSTAEHFQAYLDTFI